MKTINKEVSDSLHFLFHCSLKDTDYTTQREQFRKVYFYIEKLEDTLKEMREFCDYLLNNDKVSINGKVYYKTFDDDIVTKKLLEIINKGIGEDK